MDVRQFRVSVAGAVTVLVSLGVVAIDARADHGSAAADPSGTSLVLTVGGQGVAGHSVTLHCHPPGGTHPEAEGACTTLDAAGGDIDKVPPTPGMMCPHLVRPVTATATGSYRGRPLSWTRTFNNSCEMDRATHPIFNF